MTKSDWKRLRDYFKGIEKYEVGGEIELTEINLDMNTNWEEGAEPIVFVSFKVKGGSK